jgi:hypothetical protein
MLLLLAGFAIGLVIAWIAGMVALYTIFWPGGETR